MTLQQVREQVGMSQYEVSSVVGVTIMAYFHWERGDYEPRDRYRPLLAQTLGVTVPELNAAIKETRDARTAVVS